MTSLCHTPSTSTASGTARAQSLRVDERVHRGIEGQAHKEKQGTSRLQSLTVGKGRAGSRVTGLRELTDWFGKQSFSPGKFIREGPAGSRTAERGPLQGASLLGTASFHTGGTKANMLPRPTRLPDNEANEEKRRPEAPLLQSVH